jgi:hypothetical protein
MALPNSLAEIRTRLCSPVTGAASRVRPRARPQRRRGADRVLEADRIS